MIQPFVDKVAEWASTPERQEEILRAKQEYCERTGEFHEDDKSFEQRMAGFLEYWLFDRNLEKEGVPPVVAYAQLAGLQPEERAYHEALGRSIHGIFEVKKIGTRAGLRVVETISGKSYEVYERRSPVALEKGDILDARLVPWDDDTWVFSAAFLYHPRDARKAILKEAKRRRKSGEDSPLEFAWDLAKMALKLERYRNVAVENIYKFD